MQSFLLLKFTPQSTLTYSYLVSFSPQVGWLKVDSQTILTLQNRVVTHNARVTLTHDQHRTWNLHIRQVKESDSGCYMCQINTPIMKNQVGCIKVHGEWLTVVVIAGEEVMGEKMKHPGVLYWVSVDEKAKFVK